MLARLPTELLLHNVLCYLPKKDLLALLRTSKVLAAVATELIDPEARCTTPEQCDALCSRLLADSQSGARLRHLRRLDICCIDLATDELLHLLQGAHDVVHLVINNKLYAHAPTRNSICSMHGLKSLTLINHPADVATYPFPSQIEEMRIFAYSMDPTDYGPFVLALSELANLHTLDLRIDDMPNSFGRGMPVISSVNHLSLHIFNEQRKLSFPMILRLFPHVSMLPLRLRMMMYLRADKDNHRVLTVRLQRLDMPYMGTQHTSTRLACLQLNWLDFCDDACNADPDDMIPTLKIVSGFCCKGYPLGVTLLKPTVLGERLWQDVASVTPSLRWLWVDNPDEPDGLPKHVPVKSIAQAAFAGRYCPLRLVVLSLGIRSTIVLDSHTLKPVSSTARNDLKSDEVRRLAYASILPSYIPSLRYLLFSRFHYHGRFLTEFIDRFWTCYRIVRGVQGPELVEIPTWEAERVLDYCRDAADPGAFHKFDERFVPLR